MRDAVLDILFCGEMRKKCGRLEEITEAAILCGDVSVCYAFEESFVRNGDATLVGRDEAGDAIEKSGFSSSRRTEKNRDAGRDGEINVEKKRGTSESCANGKRGGV